MSWSAKRACTELPSNVHEVGLDPAAAQQLLDTRGRDVGSTLTVALPPTTCTAGASPKKLGSV